MTSLNQHMAQKFHKFRVFIKTQKLWNFWAVLNPCLDLMLLFKNCIRIRIASFWRPAMKLYWPLLGQKKTCLVIFLWKRKTSSDVFLANVISNGLYQAIKNNIVAKKTTELVLLFHKNITKQVFLCPNMNHKWFKVLI